MFYINTYTLLKHWWICLNYVNSSQYLVLDKISYLYSHLCQVLCEALCKAAIGLLFMVIAMGGRIFHDGESGFSKRVLVIAIATVGWLENLTGCFERGLFINRPLFRDFRRLRACQAHPDITTHAIAATTKYVTMLFFEPLLFGGTVVDSSGPEKWGA